MNIAVKVLATIAILIYLTTDWQLKRRAKWWMAGLFTGLIWML